MNIVLDPLSLALSDPDVDAHIPFDPMTEHIPLGIFEEVFSDDIIDRIKKTNFYKDFVTFFLIKEEMNEATYNVVRNQHFDTTRLDEIHCQLHMLNSRQALCFCLLRAGIPISHFYFQDDFLGYSTNIVPAHLPKAYSSNQFDGYTVGGGEQNIVWNGMYISVYQVFDTYIILQHNDRFEEDTLSNIQETIKESNKNYDKFIQETSAMQGYGDIE